MPHTKTLFLTSLFALSGCLHSPVAKPPQSDPALVVLSEVAKEVRSTTRKVAEIQQANHPVHKSISTTDPALREKITVLDYAGSPAPLLQRISMRLGYRFVDHSNRGIRLSPVTISSDREEAIVVIQDIAAQIGQAADIVVSEQERSIRLVSR